MPNYNPFSGEFWTQPSGYDSLDDYYADVRKYAGAPFKFAGSVVGGAASGTASGLWDGLDTETKLLIAAVVVLLILK